MQINRAANSARPAHTPNAEKSALRQVPGSPGMTLEKYPPTPAFGSKRKQLKALRVENRAKMALFAIERHVHSKGLAISIPQ
jgi:hypothetical protein